ncbi:lipopolysaccharide biosynthesis protein [Parabacteroides johnsonii]|uniref:lipopolysaccharide biosynthesis protein n=1 Tax=Parabacteroides johnsonii TaxID=387661 RepID=UPI00248EE0E5|nr:lipopolysaccharide biosynthesis protein [Parabacteroides johnsonii]
MGLRQKTISGLIWTASGTLGNGIVSFFVTMILARMLLPYHFALIELLIVFISISNVIVDSGFSQAIIRDDNPSDTDLSSIFYFNITLAVIIYVLLFFAAPFISLFFRAPELTMLSRIVFLVVIFNAFSIIQNATLNRSLDFAAVSKSQVIGTFIAGVVSVTMAIANCGIWALVANMVLQPFLRSILLWVQSGWNPVLKFNIKSIRKYFGFGIFLMIQGIVDAVVSNIISLLIGKTYSKNELGYYSQGNKLNSYVFTPSASVIKKVTYPILSKLKYDDEGLLKGYMQVIRLTLFAFVPISVFLMVAADNFVTFIFGEKWLPAGDYVAMFAIAGLFYPLQEICINILLVKGKSKINLNISLCRQTLRILSVILFIGKGVLPLTLAFIVAGTAGSIIFIYFGLKEIRYNFRQVIKNCKIIVLSALGANALAVAVNHYLASSLSTSVVFLIQIFTMGTGYLLMCGVFKEKALFDAIHIIKPILYGSK